MSKVTYAAWWYAQGLISFKMLLYTVSDTKHTSLNMLNARFFSILFIYRTNQIKLNSAIFSALRFTFATFCEIVAWAVVMNYWINHDTEWTTQYMLQNNYFYTRYYTLMGICKQNLQFWKSFTMSIQINTSFRSYLAK